MWLVAIVQISSRLAVCCRASLQRSEGLTARADWRRDAPYRALIGIDRAGLAWEWLRRDPGYDAFWRATQAVTEPTPTLMRVPAHAGALDWGLHFRGVP